MNFYIATDLHPEAHGPLGVADAVLSDNLIMLSAEAEDLQFYANIERAQDGKLKLTRVAPKEAEWGK